MILVSGANGFLGQAIIRQLTAKKHKVVGLVFNFNKKFLLKDKNLKYIKLDITKQNDFKKINKIKNIEAVFHTAAHIDFDQNLATFEKCFKVNVSGTVNLLEFCRKNKIKKFVFSSTANVYDQNNKSPVKETDSVFPDNFYSQSKLAAERACLYYQRIYGMKIIILRYSGLYGWQGQSTNAVNIFVNQAIKNKDILIYGKGDKIRDWTYVKDAAGANIKCLNYNRVGIFNISSGGGFKIKEAAELVKKIFNSSSKIIFIKNSNKDTSPAKIVYDISKAKKELKFVSTPLAKALLEIKSNL